MKASEDAYGIRNLSLATRKKPVNATFVQREVRKMADWLAGDELESNNGVLQSF
jgi:hypothetical protein